MAIAASMNNNQEVDSSNKKQLDGDDEHEYDMVMPGFRFHPTEEELVEFYLRRKVEGKRFNVELITFLDLYRYDPWELPALAAIGEKEWYFYVPRDRKYRNGDRPNRVTTSGYWKATGADRMIRSENLRSIGLKKTLVFYSGKAPKGIRTSWIMNEYRLPLHETERLQKAEISLCRVYKRAGVEDHPSLPRSLPTRASSSRSASRNQTTYGSNASHRSDGSGKLTETSPTSSNSYSLNPILPIASPTIIPSPTSGQEDSHTMIMSQSKQPSNSSLSPTIFASSSSSSSHAIDDLHKLVNINYSQQVSILSNQDINPHYPSNNIVLSQFSSPLQPTTTVGLGSFHAAFSDRLWDWSGISDANKDFYNLFK
ncbi:hypothetical protein CDL12_09945 [Handroanthus impetiginosus]|uniref:NAC domain-containing protein n=1 Tax=Handroanthus impetiginosus TaxID=429701 RepID=A0A2G9HIS2_9LAMI|nr:hypothetical protein CDL12_09945 [Handroanthus impetiginosus]